MLRRSSRKFVNLFRVSLLGLLLVFFHLLAPQSYASNPVTGSWTLVGLSNQTVASLAVDPTNRNTLYAGTQQGASSTPGVFKSTDSGASWTAITNGLPITFTHSSYDALAIDPSNHNVVYVGISGDSARDGLSYEGIFKSTDGGTTWTQITPNNNGGFTSVLDIAIDPSNTSTIYIAGAHSCNAVWKSTDGGTTWTRTPVPTCDTIVVALDPSNHNTVYATNGGNVIKSTDGASSWSIVLAYNPNSPITTSNAPISGLAIDPFNTNVLYASSGFTGVSKSTDGGASWTFLTGSPTTVSNGVITDSARTNTVYAAGGNNTAYQSTNAGVSWSSINNGWPSGGYSTLVHFSNDPDALYAGNTNGGVYVYGLNPTNQPPTAISFPGGTLNEGGTYTSNGSFTDTDSTSWTGRVNYGDGSGEHDFASPNESLNQTNQTFTISHVYKDEGSYTVTVKITDNQGATGSGTATVTVNNATPVVGAISVSTNPVQVNTTTTASASFTDAGVLDTHNNSGTFWSWGDGSTTNATVTESNGSGSISDSHTYTAAGVYTITLTVTDDDNTQPGTQTFQYVSVYNPTPQGLFTAGQRFASPVGAYPQNPLLTGDVRFGLSYKYSGTMPTSDRQFTMNFPAATLTFNATTVTSLVIANSMATLTGTGTINGAGNYNFLVTGVNGGGIRVQITDPSNNNNVIYDTQPGAPATVLPITPVTGQVIVH